MKINLQNDRLHEETKELARTLTKVEIKLVSRLMLVEEREAYRDLGHQGLYTYCTQYLEMTEPAAQMYRNLINRSLQMPALREALESDDPARKITPSYAIRIVASLTPENVSEVLAYATKHSIKKTQAWLVREKGVVRLIKMTVDTEILDLLREVKTLLPGNVSDLESMKRALRECRDRLDPVKKAKRSMKREKPTTGKPKTAADKETSSKRRRPLSAREKHTIILRDQNRCTFQDERGHRCSQNRWLHTHHMNEVSEGGSNDPSNLLTLCAEHHDLVHQMCFPIDIQRSWIPGEAEQSENMH